MATTSLMCKRCLWCRSDTCNCSFILWSITSGRNCRWIKHLLPLDLTGVTREQQRHHRAPQNHTLIFFSSSTLCEWVNMACPMKSFESVTKAPKITAHNWHMVNHTLIHSLTHTQHIISHCCCSPSQFHKRNTPHTRSFISGYVIQTYSFTSGVAIFVLMWGLIVTMLCPEISFIFLFFFYLFRTPYNKISHNKYKIN